MKKQQTHYRQGDVLIERVDSLPSKLKLVARENGRVILAHGEVTGHAHAIADKGTELLADDTGNQFVRVKGSVMKTRLPNLRKWRDQVLVKHPERGLVQFAVEDVTISGKTVEIDGEFALLTHDEHTAHAVPAGYYRNIRQSEYDPEEIRSVLD